MSYSLLDIVQLTLASMDGDEVNSITDTTESVQVANCARVVYDELIASADLPREYQAFQLTASTNTALPIVMYKPDTFQTVEWIKYKGTIPNDTSGLLEWRRLEGVAFDEFLKRSDGLSTFDANVATMELTVPNGNIEINYYNDRAPDYYTSFDDKTILFSSINLTVETTLQTSHTLCYGQYTDQFIQIDSFTPIFNNQTHYVWLQETKALASAEMRQVVNNKAEKSARKGWIRLQDLSKQSIATDSYYNRLPNYGRRPPAGYSPTNGYRRK